MTAGRESVSCCFYPEHRVGSGLAGMTRVFREHFGTQPLPYSRAHPCLPLSLSTWAAQLLWGPGDVHRDPCDCFSWEPSAQRRMHVQMVRWGRGLRVGPVG